MEFKHPTEETKLEGTYVVKDENNKYVYLSNFLRFSDDEEFRNHEDIKNHLYDYGITDELEFEEDEDGYTSAFMDA